MDEIKDILVNNIIKNIVSVPEDVQVSTSEGSDDKGEYIAISVKVNKADVGRCIGEEGNNAEAIRKVVALIAWRKLGKRVRTIIDAPKKTFTYGE